MHPISCKPGDPRGGDAPPYADQHSKQFRGALTRVTHEWFQKFCDAGCGDDLIHSLPDAWIAELGDSTGSFATWYEAKFMSWGQDDLPEVIADFHRMTEPQFGNKLNLTVDNEPIF